MACGATLSLKRTLEFDNIHITPRQKRRRCDKLTTMTSAAAPTRLHQNSSPFTDVNPKYTTEQINASITSEIRRMHRRRQLPVDCDSRTMSYSSPPSPTSSLSGSSSPIHTEASSSTSTSSSSRTRRYSSDAPLFTQKQVSIVCEKLIRDREDQIREHYDRILTTKLAEQYEAFLKFNHDQLHRRFQESAASYVS